MPFKYWLPLIVAAAAGAFAANHLWFLWVPLAMLAYFIQGEIR